MTIVHDWKPLFIVTNSFILDIAGVLDPLLKVFTVLQTRFLKLNKNLIIVKNSITLGALISITVLLSFLKWSFYITNTSIFAQIICVTSETNDEHFWANKNLIAIVPEYFMKGFFFLFTGSVTPIFEIIATLCYTCHTI